MGHLDGRINEGETPSPAAGGTKDGPTGSVTKEAPHKDDGADAPAAKAPDVLHGGDNATKG